MPYRQTRRTSAMTLIEVLVALTVASFVFSSLLQMAFDSLKRAKNLELQDKMRNYATDFVQIVYNAKDTDWEGSFGEPTPPAVAAMPPSVNNAPEAQKPLGYIKISTVPGEKSTLETLPYDVCHFDETRGVLEGSSCEDTAADEKESAYNRKMFGRIVKRLDNDIVDSPGERDTVNDASIEVIVACLENKCDGTNFKPFKLSFQIYRTSGPQ